MYRPKRRPNKRFGNYRDGYNTNKGMKRPHRR